jgi:hypothetical protein
LSEYARQATKRMKRVRVGLIITFLVLGLWVSSCVVTPSPVAGTAQPNLNWTPTFTPFQPLHPTPARVTAQPTQKPTRENNLGLWVNPLLPDALKNVLTLPTEFTVVEQQSEALIGLEVSAEAPISRWVYALVAPFPTIPMGVSSEDLHHTWGGQPSGPFKNRPLLMSESTLAVFSFLWGDPAAGSVEIQPEDQVLDYAWRHRPSWAIVPFEELEPRWKVLEVDGMSPIRVDFDLDTYPLSAPISLSGDPSVKALLSVLSGNAADTHILPPSNRDPNKLTTLVMTGVTALVRATAFTMEQRGVEYPGRDVRDWLRSADITHISNEVPFAKNCPFPDPVQPDMRFCSRSKYIGLLEFVGTDVVELTGDHFQDWGNEAMYYTLDMYKERGWLFYGGGENLKQGRRAITLEHNGNRLAFLGCNGKGGGYAQASSKRPGAVKCDFDWIKQEISRSIQEGYLPIFTFQHFEYYTYQAQPSQIRDFGRVARAGAVIVSGSQAHQPQGLEFVDGALIHYGLGNLFFDQFEVSKATRQAFIDRHVFYNGRYISTELLPIMFVDYARPRPMTSAERKDLLSSVFKASGW